MPTLRQKSEDIQASLNSGLLDLEEAAGHLLIVHGDFLLKLEEMLDKANQAYGDPGFNQHYARIFDWLWHEFKEKDDA